MSRALAIALRIALCLLAMALALTTLRPTHHFCDPHPAMPSLIPACGGNAP